MRPPSPARPHPRKTFVHKTHPVALFFVWSRGFVHKNILYSSPCSPVPFPSAPPGRSFAPRGLVCSAGSVSARRKGREVATCAVCRQGPGLLPLSGLKHCPAHRVHSACFPRFRPPRTAAPSACKAWGRWLRLACPGWCFPIAFLTEVHSCTSDRPAGRGVSDMRTAEAPRHYSPCRAGSFGRA